MRIDCGSCRQYKRAINAASTEFIERRALVGAFADFVATRRGTLFAALVKEHGCRTDGQTLEFRSVVGDAFSFLGGKESFPCQQVTCRLIAQVLDS